MKLNGERDEAGVDVGAGGASAGAGAKVTFSIKWMELAKEKMWNFLISRLTIINVTKNESKNKNPKRENQE